MAEDDERRSAFEARLAELKRRMETGLLARAHTLREAAARLLAGDTTARRVLKQESHKLRGVAGSYGYDELTALAAELETRASLSPPSQLHELATRLADAASAVGERSTAAVSGAVRPIERVSTHPRRVSAAPPTKPHTRAGAARPNTLGAHGGALRVLAMDDDPTTLRLLHLTLSEVGGFDPILVTSGRDALAQLCIREFDVVISDAMMPDMNGREFCAAARELGGYAATVPIIILSAATQDELRWRSALPGPVVWLRKPFIPSALVQDIAKVVNEHRA
jgi:CheY-like chemotaxis protein/HPt (histidine-containing phosphotransfer) domain-containing protein